MNRESEPGYGNQNRGVHFLYLALTVTQMLGGGIVLYREAGRAWNDWDLWVHLWTNLSYIAITAAAVSICVTELGGYIVVLAKDFERWLKRKREEQQRKREKQQERHDERTRQEVYKLVSKWNDRRLAAQRRGEPFDEPPPGINSTDSP